MSDRDDREESREESREENREDREPERGSRRRDEGEPPRSPDYVAYNVRKRDDEKSLWDRVGVGFEHRDGEGVNVQLNSMPMDGRVTLRRLREEEFKAARQDEDRQSRSRKRDR